VIAIAAAFRDAAPPLTAGGLSESLCLPVRTVRDIADQLARVRILAERTTGEGEAYSLGQPAERIRVVDILAALRGARDQNGETDETVEGVLAELASNASHGPGGRSIADLLTEVTDSIAEPGEATDRRFGVA